MASEKIHHTVIVGAGFAGLSVANELEKRHRRLKRRSKITLIDKRVGQVYYPLLYEVATGELVHSNMERIDALGQGVVLPFPVAAKVLDGDRTSFKRGAVVDVQQDTSTVILKDGSEVTYDSLVMAIGAKTATYDVGGVEAYAYTLKSFNNAAKIRSRLDVLLQEYQNGSRDRINVVMVGAGPTGVEFIAELANCVNRWGQDGEINVEDVTLDLVESGPNILSAYDDRFRAKAVRRLMDLNINIHLETRVVEVKKDRVSLGGDGQQDSLSSDLTVWATGNAPHPLPKRVGLPTDEKGFVQIDDTLAVQERDGIFALGDCASFYYGKNDDKRVPNLAQAATKQAGIVAENIVRRYERRSLTKWHPPDTWMTVVPLGGKFAIADLGRWNISGWLGYAMRKIADLAYFVSVLRVVDALRVWFVGSKAYIRND